MAAPRPRHLDTKQRRSPRSPSLGPSLLTQGFDYSGAAPPQPRARRRGKLALRGSGSCRRRRHHHAAGLGTASAAHPLPSSRSPTPPHGSCPPSFYLAAPALCPLTALPSQPPRPAARRRRRPRPPLPARPQWPRQATPPARRTSHAPFPPRFPALCVRGRGRCRERPLLCCL